MRMTELNENPESNIQKARGFKLAYSMLYRKFLEEWNRPNETFNEMICLLGPLKMLFFRSVELYLRTFLLIKGVSWKESWGKMNTSGRKKQGGVGDSHDIGELWSLCSKYKDFIDDPKMQRYMEYAGGSTKNYSGAPYSESGAGGSPYHMEILEKLDEILSKHT